VKIKIRFNKSRGQPGRGTVDHVWRVFAGPKEYLAKHVEIHVKSWGEKEPGSEDWNIACEGQIQIDREKSSIRVVAEI
jgi:hypothetical protein